MSDDAEDRAVGRGMVIAAGIIMNAFDQPVYAAEILHAAGITTVDKAWEFEVDDYDIDILRPVFREIARMGGGPEDE